MLWLHSPSRSLSFTRVCSASPRLTPRPTRRVRGRHVDPTRLELPSQALLRSPLLLASARPKPKSKLASNSPKLVRTD